MPNAPQIDIDARERLAAVEVKLDVQTQTVKTVDERLTVVDDKLDHHIVASTKASGEVKAELGEVKATLAQINSKLDAPSGLAAVAAELVKSPKAAAQLLTILAMLGGMVASTGAWLRGEKTTGELITSTAKTLNEAQAAESKGVEPLKDDKPTEGKPAIDDGGSDAIEDTDEGATHGVP